MRQGTWTLLVGNTLVMIGVGFFLPILPLFIGHRQGTALVVGAVFASGLLAIAVAQYPAGALADRFGRRPVIRRSSLGLETAIRRRCVRSSPKV